MVSIAGPAMRMDRTSKGPAGVVQFIRNPPETEIPKTVVIPDIGTILSIRTNDVPRPPKRIIMETRNTDFPLRYEQALTAHLRAGREAHAERVSGCVSLLDQSGWPPGKFAALHEEILVATLLPATPRPKRPALIHKASRFFAAVTSDSGEPRPDGSSRDLRLREAIAALSTRNVTLAFTLHEPPPRSALPKDQPPPEPGGPGSGEPEMTRERLRALSRRILKYQEEERKKISRELHDVIVQSLVGVNVRLTTLRKEAGARSKELARNIASAQRLVAKSAKIVHQFARDLRPAVLDDLGLIPALHSFIHQFSKRSATHVHLTVFSGVEKLDAELRTVLFRVTQEALSNIARHARAERVEVSILRQAGAVRLEITDDGRSFNTGQALPCRDDKHLGLLGMKERIEMVGGTFHIDSAPGRGTTILATIPVSRTLARAWEEQADDIREDLS